MIDNSNFLVWLGAWLLCMAFILWRQQKDDAGAGLVISYVLQLWVIHWLAAAIYALPWYQSPDLPIRLGLEQSTYAIAGFAIGSSLLAPALLKRKIAGAATVSNPGLVDARLVHTYLVVGIVSYFVVEPMLHSVATIGAIASAMSNLLLVALGMECWNGLKAKGAHNSFWRWVLLSACLPFMTIVTKGFLSYGFAAMLTVFAFVASFYRPRWKIVVSGFLVGFLALSMYVTYMRDRKDIRASVWRGESYSARISASSRLFTDFELLDLTNIDHLVRIDERLNQNALLGASVLFLQQHPDSSGNGRTIWEAAVSLVPRILWPGKPTSAGSGTLVTEFTGIRFGEDTSVGIGHVMECYVNFGTTGVFFGMILIGTLVGWIDVNAILGLRQGGWQTFTMWWLPGIALLQVQGSLVDAVSSAGASVVVALLIQRFGRRRGPQPVPAPIVPRPSRPTLRPRAVPRSS